MKVFEGSFIVDDYKFAFVVARFNEFLTDSLLQGALDTFYRQGGKEENVAVVKVPGAFEIPLGVRQIAQTGQYDAIICLGVVIRGATPHFEYVSSGATSGIASLSLETGIPVTFGILTTDTIEQAVERAGTKAGNKGRDATQSAIEMVNLLKKIEMAHSVHDHNQTY